MWKSTQYLQKTSFTSNFQSCFSSLVSHVPNLSLPHLCLLPLLSFLSRLSVLSLLYLCPNMSQNVAVKKFRYAVAKNTTKPEIAFCALHVVSSNITIYLFAPFRFDVSLKCLILINICSLQFGSPFHSCLLKANHTRWDTEQPGQSCPWPLSPSPGL